MKQYIDKSALVAKIEGLKSAAETMLTGKTDLSYWGAQKCLCERFLSFINTLEVKDPYEQCIQYDSIKLGIQAHAETYSFNIESKLFNQLTKEQQKLWRKEIEQACISGGEMGAELARDPRYKENLEDLDEALSNLDKEIKEFVTTEEFERDSATNGHYWAIAKHVFLLCLKAQKGIVWTIHRK